MNRELLRPLNYLNPLVALVLSCDYTVCKYIGSPVLLKITKAFHPELTWTQRPVPVIYVKPVM